jgi:hypothetical protein
MSEIKELNGRGTQGHKRGRPTIFKRNVVLALINEAREKNVSMAALCAEKGIAAISVKVAKARYGMTKKRLQMAA